MLDRDGLLIDAEHAGAFTRSGAHTTGKLRKVVGLHQTAVGILPATLVHEVIPLRDQIVDRTACNASCIVDTVIRVLAPSQPELTLLLKPASLTTICR